MKSVIKKIFSTLIAFSLPFCYSVSRNIYSAHATTENLLDTNEITMIPDDLVTQDMIRVGEEYADQMNNGKQTRMDEEVWNLVSYTTVVSYGPVKGAFGDIIPVGETRTRTCSWSIGLGGTFRGYTLSASASGSLEITKSGPSSSDKLVDGKAATHRGFFAVGYGRLVKYNYIVTQKYSGQPIRNETHYMLSDVDTVSCSQLLQISGSTVYAENGRRTAVRNAGTLSNYKSHFSRTDGTCLYYYDW